MLVPNAALRPNRCDSFIAHENHWNHPFIAGYVDAERIPRVYHSLRRTIYSFKVFLTSSGLCTVHAVTFSKQVFVQPHLHLESWIQSLHLRNNKVPRLFHQNIKQKISDWEFEQTRRHWSEPGQLWTVFRQTQVPVAGFDGDCLVWEKNWVTSGNSELYLINDTSDIFRRSRRRENERPESS